MDDVNQGLTLREAVDALAYRLLAVLQAVQGLRARMHNVYCPWAYELLDAEGMLEELIGEIEQVQGTVLQTGYRPWPQALRDGERTLRELIGRYRPLHGARHADPPLVDRLLAVLRAVLGLRMVMESAYQPWARELRDAEHNLLELVGDIEHVRIDPPYLGWRGWAPERYP